MNDLQKKVVKGLIELHDVAVCDHRMINGYLTADLCFDAISLLKTQEPVSPKVDIDTYVCGVCGTRLERQSLIGPNAVLAETFNYCSNCGRKVAWNG